MTAALENQRHLIRGEEVPSESGAHGLDADLIVTAKALTSRYVTMGAVLVHYRLHAMIDGTQFRHGFTYNGHPVGAAVALANRAIIERHGLLERASRIGARMLERLRSAESLAAVAEVRGTGAMLGVELVADRDAGPVAAAARELGVIVRASGTKIVMSPPLEIEKDDADRAIDVLVQGLEAL